MQAPIEIPAEAINPETLQSLIEGFILREGTDYGAQEVELATKIKQLQKQIQNGRIKIVFDEETQSANLITEHDWKKLQK